MTFTTERIDNSNGWRVHAVDPITFGLYSAEFSGDLAEDRARAYARWMNNAGKVRGELEEIREEIIKLRKEIEQIPKFVGGLRWGQGEQNGLKHRPLTDDVEGNPV